MKGLGQHIREAMLRELEPDGLFLPREHADAHHIVQIGLEIDVGRNVLLVYLLEVLNAVQRDIIDGVLLLVKAEEEPTIVVLLDIVGVDGPVVDHIGEGLVLDVKDAFVDDGVEEILEPVEAGVGFVFVVTNQAA